MGFFEDVVSKNKTQEEINELEQKVKDLWRKYIRKYDMLSESDSYQSKLIDFQGRIVEEATSYFKPKGFKITQFEGGTVGVVAEVDDTKFSIFFGSKNEIEVKIPGVWHEELTISDKKQKKNIFQGYVYDNTLFYTKRETLNKYDDLLVAKKEIEEDISIVDTKRKNNYSPELYITSEERERTFNDIIEYLDLLNNELKE